MNFASVTGTAELLLATQPIYDRFFNPCNFLPES